MQAGLPRIQIKKQANPNLSPQKLFLSQCIKIIPPTLFSQKKS